MKIRNIQLDAEERPELITVEMTLTEAVFMAKVTGELSTKTAREQYGNAGSASSDVYDALVGGFFNRFCEDGVAEVEVPAC